jgi:hypothetical protein
VGCALLIETIHEKVGRTYRIVFILVFLAGYLATVIPLYLTFTTVGLDEVLGVQGRYFIPLALLPVLVLSSILVTKKIAILSSNWIITFLAITLSLNILGINLAFYVPCGTTFYQTGLCYQPVYKDFTSETHISPPLSDEISLTQEINVACNGLTELRVLLTPFMPGDQGTTRFILQDQLRTHTLMDSSITNDQILAETWYPLSFDPDWNSAGKGYVLKILGADTSSSQGLRLLYTPQSEFDLGNLYENGQPLEEDIIIQYGCITGLRKILLTGQP